MAADPTAIVRIRGLRKLSLQEIDFILKSGERVAIIGESGSGKSVLVECLLGLVRPEDGEIEVLGTRVRGRPVQVEDLGVAFQQPGLFDASSVAENLQLASSVPLGSAKIRALLDSVGLDEVATSARPGTLSGGQQKRVALLRALLRGIRLVVLDEPTSGLDPETTRHLLEFLTKHFTSAPAALLLVTHDYNVASELCTRILLLSEGRFVDVSPLAGLGLDARVDSLRGGSIHSTGAPSLRDAGGEKYPSLFVRTLVDFTTRGVPMSVGVMALLGGLLVIQSAGVSPIDVSRLIPGLVATSVFRELSPLVVGLLLASRIGARVSAEVSGMSYTAQLDSMRVLGVSTRRALLLPFGVSASLSFPVCILGGGFAALLIGGLISGTAISGLHIGSHRFFFLALQAINSALIISCLLKGILMGLVVASISYRIGSSRVKSASQLGRLVTTATMTSSLAVVMIDIVISSLFFSGGSS